LNRLRDRLRHLRLPAAAVIAVSALALPASASAGTLTVDHLAHTATYKANAGEANDLSFYKLSNTYRIQDEPAVQIPLTELGSVLCSIAEPWKFRCPAASVATASVSLGDGADLFNAATTPIAFTIVAGAGADSITTGSGADVINAQNGSADKIVCGDGADTVVADADDAVDATCEKVDRLSAGAGGATGLGSHDPTGNTDGGSTDTDTGNGNSGNVFETPLGLSVALAHVPLANFNARFHLQCAAENANPCRGDMVLELAAKKAKRAQKGKVKAARGQFITRQRSRRNRRLGKSTYLVAPGEKKTVRMPMLQRGHYRYVSRRRRTRAVLRVTERDPAGKVIDVQTRSVVLKGKRGQR
jgi:hypothetical protein